MYCSFCGKEIQNEDVFCPNCGKNKETGRMIGKENDVKIVDYNIMKRLLVILVCGSVLAIVIWFAGARNLSVEHAIVGTWENESGDRISFSKDSIFKENNAYGIYEIFDNKDMLLDYQNFNNLLDSHSYSWTEDAKESQGWYISGNSLYINGEKYNRQ